MSRSSASQSHGSVDQDAEQLRALGYSSNFNRSMSLWENFSLGFTYLSPVVGVYTLFGLCLAAGGPPMFWSYLLIGCGQLLVCLVFGEIVSQYPISGGVYPWARRLVGKRWAWMVGWVYAWALCATIAGVAVGAGPYLSAMLGFAASSDASIYIALVLILLSTCLNLVGTKLLARVAMFGFLCELIGAILVGGYLLMFERHQPLSVLFDTFGLNSHGSYLPAFLAASLAGLFQYYGFEACGDVAEETPNPGRRIPKAMRMTIYIGGAAAMFACLALILSVPDIQKVLAGEDTDPVSTILANAFGPVGSKLVMAVVMVSFISCVLSLQAAASRLLFAYARDEMIVGSGLLRRLSTNQVPSIALLVSGVIPAAIVCLGLFMADAVATIVGFAAIGIYIAFQLIVIAALIARVRGWRPTGQFTLGGWGLLVNLGALVYGIGAIINMVWPRTPDAAWYINYSMILTTVVVMGAGFVYMLLAKPYDKGTAPYGDAWKQAAPRPQSTPGAMELAE
ncbi:APC family permease [Shimwellia blattae]|uniref:Putative amino acid permease n=1 Tax=Shimwellia blattae (strain ATCC 29907 / DSM 4481 / JCM 1650 / NBRC 105725 / CDC 9005-74) TaxID=630626 RepID=I2B7V7_SHIBC|nr:APC family permease [Shimwellia blattae]AFJ46611.1 putative amino acid permease [Shimwellia blattae DSM 4481 = NBRC 105725]GAB80191.1 putative amino acid transporter [Shimwellia blattae DSM 4481 = NBRC 105725]VDY64083.1 Putrescine importer PuuP [Shimwellia blattae]VEC22215.1 Putrescine importer PuuP [Shimwellia blattae]